MSRESIAKGLKFYRKLNNYKVADVVLRLSESGRQVAEKTVYGWESGQALPDSECLIELCSIYNIHDVSYALGEHEITDIITPNNHEKELIKKYRSNTKMQPAIDKLLGLESQQSNY